MYANTYTNTRNDVIEMFLDGTANEVYYDGRIITRQSGESTVELIAYGQHKLAEYNEATDTVTLFAGHAGNISRTVTEYVNVIDSLATDRQSRTVNKILDAAPNVEGPPPAEAAQFIDNYKSFSGSDSSVEQWATEKVNNAVSSAVSSLL